MSQCEGYTYYHHGVMTQPQTILVKAGDIYMKYGTQDRTILDSSLILNLYLILV